MSLTIQRPADATTLAHCHANAPVSAQLVVAPDEQVVVVGSGAVHAVLPPGSYTLYPDHLPFLATMMAGDVVAAELWFVRTVPLRGLAFGGSLGSIVDAPTRVACDVRCFGELAVSASDPVRLVLACAGQGASDQAILDWVKQVVMQQLGDGLAHLAREGTSLLARDLTEQLHGQVAPDFTQVGVVFGGFGALTINFSEESMTALKQAQVAAGPKRTLQGATATGARCPKCAKPHGGGKFCGECGAPVPA